MQRIQYGTIPRNHILPEMPTHATPLNVSSRQSHSSKLGVGSKQLRQQQDERLPQPTLALESAQCRVRPWETY